MIKLILLLWLLTNSGLSFSLSRQEIGKLFIVGLDKPYITPMHPLWGALQKGDVGGVILFSRNIRSKEQLKSLTKTLHKISFHQLIIAIDQEGGRVARLNQSTGYESTLSARSLAKLGVDKTKEQAALMASWLKEANINLNLAPVVDLEINPNNPIIAKYGRSFSRDPNVVINHAREFVEEHNKLGIGNSLKHFPGHGSSTGDTHLGLVDITNDWQEIELKPFEYFASINPPPMMMMAHVIHRHYDPSHPLSLSPALIQSVIRDRFNFHGPIMTDDLQMRAITQFYSLDETVFRALNAGNDFLLFSHPHILSFNLVEKLHKLIQNFIKKGILTEERLDQSIERIDRFKQNLNNFK